MSIFDQLAETRIREWRERGTPGKPGLNADTPDRGHSFEIQVLHQIVELIQQAKASNNRIERAKIEQRAMQLEIQPMASLERNGFSLTAKRIADELQNARVGNDTAGCK